MIYEIKSKQNDKIKEVVKLQSPTYSKTKKLFVVEGFHSLEMALQAKVVKEVYSVKKLSKIPSNVDQYIVSKEIMEKISTTKSPQGVVVVCNYLEPRKVSSDKILFLDNVRDPGNLGTLLRTALAFGYKDVFICEGCSAYNPKVLAASQGAIFNLNLLDLLPLKIINEYEVIATEIKGSVKLSEFKPQKKHILILGNEAHGVSKEFLDMADKRVRIEINEIESLNVAVAGAIAMYEFSK